ncbi:hypothetical protein GA0074692_3239 [Micromonospora pallida]|uniref:Uncharacterized protein n=1 Tax=Micromonospora pallida TaxID=145854 RepID=A0A1C6SRG8_9ACTN|nr:hypothetical protein [Micromonospora pallida]SCL32097.1 hypothetical protein GA0074692_3239 [Micromonospora pallida]
METTLLDRPRPTASPTPLDWPTMADAFEVACLLRCMSLPTGPRGRHPGEPYRSTVEFNREDAALRMRQLLGRLGVPVEHEITVGGLRRRYELHQLRVPAPARATYVALLDSAWRQGRRELLGVQVPGASTSRRVWRSRLAAAAWRSALLAGGRHVRRHILGVRLTDRELAAVLVRGAALLEVPATLRPGAGCFVVSVADGPDRNRILESASLHPAPMPTAEAS